MDPYTQARCLGGQRYLADEIRDALEVQRGQQDRVDYLSYANFQDHDFTGASRWSSRKSPSPFDQLPVGFDPCAEKCGGARTAYYYGLLLRQKLAKELENGAASVHGFLLLLDRVFLGDAKEKSKVVPK